MESPAEKNFLYPTAMPPLLPGLNMEEMGFSVSALSAKHFLPLPVCSPCVYMRLGSRKEVWDLLVREPLVSKK